MLDSSQPAAFTYPPSPHIRRHGPAGYKDYRSYRPWLRDEFSFRCVYCLLRETWRRVRGEFDLDHFVPQVQRPDQPPDYDNLVCACHSCNLRKASQILPNIWLTSENVRVYPNGAMVGLTPEADRTIRMLWLNSPESIQWRRMWHRIIQLAEESDPDLNQQLMGYPDDLPDLSICESPEKTRPEGIELSHFAKRQRNDLPIVFLS